MIRYSESRYISNCSILKKYTENKYKLVTLRNVKVGGYEEDKNTLYEVENKNNCNRNVNDEKLANHISRAKSKIYEYALCNDFDYFVTLTLDKNKMDRSNINEYIKKLSQYIRDMRKTDQKIQYILIPEKHRDGKNWHMHGLMKGLEDLRRYDVSENIPKRMKDKIIKYREENLHLYEWEGYSKRFGFNCIEPIRNKDACSRYITKYVSKNLDNDMGITEKNKKKYYASRGLKTAKNIAKGVIPTGNIIYDFENEHCKIKWLNKSQAKEIEKIFKLF